MVFPMLSMTRISFLSFPLEMEVVSGQTLRTVQHHKSAFQDLALLGAASPTGILLMSVSFLN